MKYLDMLFIKSKLAINSFVNGLKDDERGLSGVVIAIMLVAIAVLAVGLFWDQLQTIMSDLWDGVDPSAALETN